MFLINQERILSGLGGHVLGLMALGMALFYGIASALIFFYKPSIKALAYIFGVISLILATIAIPFLFNVHLVSGIWAIEGAGLIALGLYQKRKLEIFSGALLQLVAGFILMSEGNMALSSSRVLPAMNATFINALVVAFSGLISFCLVWRAKDKIKAESVEQLGFFSLYWGGTWWLFSVIFELSVSVADRYLLAMTLLFGVISFVLLVLLERVSRYRNILLVRHYLIFIAIVLGAAIQAFPLMHSDFALPIWFISLACGYWSLYQAENDCYDSYNLLTYDGRSLGHCFAMVSLIGLLIGKAAFFWGTSYITIIVIGLVPSLFILSILLLSPKIKWPFQTYQLLYQKYALIALCGIILTWMLCMSFYALSLPVSVTKYPIINFLDMTALFAFAVTVFCVHKNQDRLLQCAHKNAFFMAVFAYLSVVFIWANSVIARTAHYWLRVPYSYYAIMHSVLLQTIYSIFWAIIASTIVIFAVMRKKRWLWFVGAGCMTVVVLKLLFIDLSNTATIGRIIAFLGVGLLLMVLGYFAPIPPVTKKT